jgi:predicted enzyme related to lactoylglutathione lyase
VGRETAASGQVMIWFMTELPARDESVTARWYQRHFGFTVERHDVDRSFILLRQGDRRLAFKRSPTVDPSAILHFQVDNLEAAIQRIASSGIEMADDVKSSDEGYRRIRLADPDGRTVVVFEWIRDRPVGSITPRPST